MRKKCGNSRRWASLLLVPVSFMLIGQEQGSKAGAWGAGMKNLSLGPGSLDVGVNIRARGEHTRNWDVRTYPAAENDNLLLFRSRLSLDYRFSKTAHAYLEMQDARYVSKTLKPQVFQKTSPQDPNPHKDENELRAAFVEWEKIGGTPLGFKVGRQAITYGDRRVFGPGEWGNVGRYWWDAGKLYFHTDPVKVDVLVGSKVLTTPTSFDKDHEPFRMGAIYAQFRQFKGDSVTVNPQLFYVGRYDDHGNLKGESGTGNETRHTLGFQLVGKMGSHVDYNSTFAKQLGNYGKDDINTLGLVAGLGYTFDAPLSPRLYAEYAFASGDKDPNDGRRGTFDNIYGAADAYYYGWMNVTSWVNLTDYMLSFSVNPTKDSKVWVEYNKFELSSAKDAWYWGSGKAVRRDKTGQSGKDLGYEINLLGQWKINSMFDVLLGGGYFRPGKFMQVTPGGSDPAKWLFAQVTFKI